MNCKKTTGPASEGRYFSFFLLAFAALLGITSCGRPVAQFSYTGTSKVLSTIKFENTSEKADSFVWDFGDGKTSQEMSPQHRYLQSGIYDVKLKAIKEKKSRVYHQQLIIGPSDRCLVKIETPYGDMIAELFNATPKHQDNFTKLVDEHYFDSLLFHRVIDGFMLQGGDPQSRNAGPKEMLGSGGPGYTIPAEFVDSLIHVKGALSAARTGDQVNPEKRSSGSQFFVVQGKTYTDQELDVLESRKNIRYTTAQRELYKTYGGTPFLDRDYTVFGRVIEGLSVIDRIAEQPTDSRDRPQENIWMKLTIIK